MICRREPFNAADPFASRMVEGVSFSNSCPLVSGIESSGFLPIVVKHQLVNAERSVLLYCNACHDVTTSPPIQKFAVLIFVAANLSAKSVKFGTM